MVDRKRVSYVPLPRDAEQARAALAAFAKSVQETAGDEDAAAEDGQ